MPRRVSAAIAALLGLVVIVAGCAAAWNYGVVADETGSPGFNPLLWIIILAGLGIVVTGAVQLNGSARRD